jgi:hypothetical protein
MGAAALAVLGLDGAEGQATEANPSGTGKRSSTPRIFPPKGGEPRKTALAVSIEQKTSPSPWQD